ncbi:MAG: hypothetical protein KDN20_04230 [Verrucomicrobiae bacterium]|nr:hypothetical protein [Verrucomicrobiae bacterium]
MKLTNFALICLLLCPSPGSAEEKRLPLIPDRFLTEALERLDRSIKDENAEAMPSQAYFLKRASERFAIVYGEERWLSIRPSVAEALKDAENVANNVTEKSKIEGYRQSLFEKEKGN